MPELVVRLINKCQHPAASLIPPHRFMRGDVVWVCAEHFDLSTKANQAAIPTASRWLFGGCCRIHKSIVFSPWYTLGVLRGK